MQRTKNGKLPVLNWATNLEEGAVQQAENMSNLPCAFHHIAIMPDGHSGYGVPIGGVMALRNAICPNAIGVDIGCGMRAVRTDLPSELLSSMRVRRDFQNLLKTRVPVGEGRSNKDPQEWAPFDEYKTRAKDDTGNPLFPIDLDRRNMSTAGGGNHFAELQTSDDGFVWLMLHSGSRNLGKRIADHYHKLALRLCKSWCVDLPDDDLAFLTASSEEGMSYVSDMEFALKYAEENRRRMMTEMVRTLRDIAHDKLNAEFNVLEEIDVHHNFARLENHFGENVWVHRKGATSAREGEIGIIPGSMGTHSYIVRGLGNPDSFCSCSHGAGRRMSRTEACRTLTVAQCDKAMEGIVCEHWSNRSRRYADKGMYDLSEAPGAYKDIDEVIENEADLVRPVVTLSPLASLKG